MLCFALRYNRNGCLGAKHRVTYLLQIRELTSNPSPLLHTHKHTHTHTPLHAHAHAHPRLVLRMHEFKSLPQLTSNNLPLKAGFGQNTDMHVSPTARNFIDVPISTFPVHSPFLSLLLLLLFVLLLLLLLFLLLLLQILCCCCCCCCCFYKSSPWFLIVVVLANTVSSDVPAEYNKPPCSLLKLIKQNNIAQPKTDKWFSFPSHMSSFFTL